MKILVLGSKGQLGRCLYDQLLSTDHDVVYTSRDQIDIADFNRTKRQLLELSPDVVINAAAYTAVDKSEEEIGIAEAVNAIAVDTIAKVCKRVDSVLIHISTDYVFDGTKSSPYETYDAVNPQSVYGRTKLAGELAVQSLCEKHIIIRTSWLYSVFGNNFVKTMLSLGLERDQLTIVNDQIGTPTNARDLAGFILGIIDLLSKGAPSEYSGVFHYVGMEQCSWYGFAKEIFSLASSIDSTYKSLVLDATSSDEYPQVAPRPMYSSLSVKSILNLGFADIGRLSLSDTISEILRVN